MKIKKKFIAVFFAVAAVASMTVPGAFYAHGTGGELTATVTEKERVCERGGGECKWMVLTDEMAFKNTDSFWHFKYSSTDVQAKVKVNEEYRFTYYGWRVPFLSVYPNIVEVRDVEAF